MVQQQMHQQNMQQQNAFHPIGQPGDMMELIRMLQAPGRMGDKDIENVGLVNGNNKDMNKVRFGHYIYIQYCWQVATHSTIIINFPNRLFMFGFAAIATAATDVPSGDATSGYSGRF